MPAHVQSHLCLRHTGKGGVASPSLYSEGDKDPSSIITPPGIIIPPTRPSGGGSARVPGMNQTLSCVHGISSQSTVIEYGGAGVLASKGKSSSLDSVCEGLRLEPAPWIMVCLFADFNLFVYVSRPELSLLCISSCRVCCGQ